MSTISYSNKNEKFCLELDRVKLLLQKAGNPDKELSIIHVAGTNGKGSVCAFIEAGIISQKIRCGRFSSPELFSSEDTITVDGVCIGKRALGNIVNSLAPLCSEVEKELGKPIGSDADSNKSTYVSILGIDKSKEYADELTKKAMKALECFGDEGEFLRNLALSLISRKN